MRFKYFTLVLGISGIVFMASACTHGETTVKTDRPENAGPQPAHIAAPKQPVAPVATPPPAPEADDSAPATTIDPANDALESPVPPSTTMAAPAEAPDAAPAAEPERAPLAPRETHAPVQVANPASKHCLDNGGTLVMRKDSDGGEYGVCRFDDGSECEEWAYMRGDCAPGDCTAWETCAKAQRKPKSVIPLKRTP